MAEVITLKNHMQDKASPEAITEIRLLKLKLENFKGVKDFELHSGGGDIAVRGDNAAGKTTLADAFSWLLFNKDSLGRADFDIKTLDSSGRALRGLDHAVEAVLSLHGRKLTLRKAYKEKWTKKRGSAEREFTGHTRDHFIDGVPVNQSEYEAQIAEIATEDIFKLLTNPVHFSERLHWQERRRMLLDICGDVADVDVIASSRDLADLPDMLDGKSIDDYRKVAAARKRKINEELQRVPVRIDEVSRNMPTLEAVDLDELGKRILKLRADRNAAEEARSRIKSGGEIAERTKQLREIEATIIQEQNERRAKANAEADENRRELSLARDELETAVRQNGQIENYIKNAEADIKTFEKRMDELRKRWHEIDEEKFLPRKGDEVCVACGQKLPPEQIGEAREKAKAAFNSDKAMRLSSIVSDGKEHREKYDGLKADIEKQKEKLARGETLVAELKEGIEKLQRGRDSQADKDTPSDFSDEIIKELQQQKQEIESEIEALKSGNSEAIEKADAEIADLSQRISEVESRLSRIEQRRAGEKRIDELRSQERLFASEYEELERGLFLTEEFTRRKVSMLTERINGRFEHARFKLFDVQVNGAISECCEVTHEGVPWGSLNTGAQVNIGLDIIRTMSEHYGIAPPIFVDHSESVTRLFKTPGQQIRLIVSENHKSLHVEEVKR